MNPILEMKYFIPDVEARVWLDGRMYLYGSCDISKHNTYCSNKYYVFSSDDLINWTNHGICYSSDKANWGADNLLYAPDCIYKNGKYYLYFCMSDNSEGVATSLQPFGPFVDTKKIDLANENFIDPAVFLDDDGQGYYYWGQFNLHGAKLKENMIEINIDTMLTNIINEKEHGFHEGASIRKRNGIYYLLYTDTSRGKATCLAYAISKNPLGPFEKKGIIIDNIGCDKETWNNHGSIAEFNGQWYIFYHRSSQGTRFNRRVCVEPIYFNEDGTIDEVEMTTQGIQQPLNAEMDIDAYRACLLSGEIKTEVFKQNANEEYYEYLCDIEDNNWAAYKYINFDEGIKTFVATVSSLKSDMYIEIRLDNPTGTLIGKCNVINTTDLKNWKTVSCKIDKTLGNYALYLVVKGPPGNTFNLKTFRFER